MDYRYSGRRDNLSPWIIAGEPDAAHHLPDMGKPRRLRVLIPGKDGASSSFHGILAANVRRWGYEAVLLPQEMARDPQTWQEIEGDVLLYDMDALLQPTVALGDPGGEIASSAGADLVSFKPGWPRVRLIIALSSYSVSRASLEQVGAIALLHKPVDMRNLERYLRVFQRLLYPEEDAWRTECACSSRGREKRIGGRAPLTARILVADDQSDVTWAIRQCLIEQEQQRYHYEVREAHDGLELLEQCLIWQPHCVVTDLLMPWLNGYQVMRCLAAIAVQPLPAFVVISALMRHEIPVDRLHFQDRVVLYIEKPFEVEDLLSVVEQALVQ